MDEFISAPQNTTKFPPPRQETGGTTIVLASKDYACSSFVLKWNITIPNGGSVSGSEYG